MRSWFAVSLTTLIVNTVVWPASAQNATEMGAGRQAVAMPGKDAACRRLFDTIHQRLAGTLLNAGIPNGHKREALAKFFVDVLDIDWIAQFVADAYWRDADEADRAAFLKTYRAALTAAYAGPRAVQEKDLDMIVDLRALDFRPLKATLYEAPIEFVNNDHTTGRMTFYLMEDASGGCRALDMTVNGADLLSTQRALIQELGGVGRLPHVTQKLADQLNAGRIASGWP